MFSTVKYKNTLSVIINLAVLFLLLPLYATTVNSKSLHDNVEYRKIQVSSSAGTTFVHMVLIDRSAIEDGTLVVEPSMSGGAAGSTASVSAMASRNNAFACINGPYFANSGSRTYPLGFTVLDGKILNFGNLNRPILGLDDDGKLKIKVDHPTVFVTSEEYFNPIWLWGINTSAGADNVTLYTENWGNSVGTQGGTAVAVAPFPPEEPTIADFEITNEAHRTDLFDGEVVEIADSGNISIPDGGFVVIFRGRSEPDAENYGMGQGVAIYSYDVPTGFEYFDWIVTLGPWFMHEGHYRDYSEETSYSGGITGGATRSMIGTTWNDEIFFAVTSGASLTPRQAAEVLIDCNVSDAVMCDSGSSSGMWVETIGTIGASRSIPMGFIVREASESDLEESPNLRVYRRRLSTP